MTCCGPSCSTGDKPGHYCPKCGDEMRLDYDWDGNPFYRCDNLQCLKKRRIEWHKKHGIPLARCDEEQIQKDSQNRVFSEKSQEESR